MRPVYSIPFGADFIDELSRIIIRDGRPLNDVAIVFPGKRPALYLRRRLAEKVDGPFYAPGFFSIETFIDFIVQKTYPAYGDLDYNDAIWLLYKTMGTISAFKGHQLLKNGFGRFYYWGQHIYSFIDQLDAENIPDGRLHSLENNADLGYDVPESVNQLMSGITQLRDRFHEILDEERCFTRGYKYLRALGSLEQSLFNQDVHVYFAGPFGLTGIEKEIMKQLWQRDKADMIFEGDVEEWPILKQLTIDLGAPVERILCETRPPADISLHSGLDTHAEVLKVSAILNEKPPVKTAVVLPLSEALFPLLTFAVDSIDGPYNISLGYPLLRTPVFDLVSKVINTQMTRRPEGVYPASAYLQVMLHPFVKNLTLDTRLRSVLLILEKMFTGEGPGNRLANKAFITLSEVEVALKAAIRRERSADDLYGAQKALHEIHTVFLRSFETAHTLNEYGEGLEGALNFVLHNTNVRSFILSGEIFKQSFQVLENIRGTRFSKERFDEDDGENRRILGDFFLQLLKSTTLPFETTPVEPLEIIGVLESRNIRFDTVIMLDVNEGVMPKPRKIDPLVPLGVYDKLGIPSPDQNEEIYRYYFYRLIRSAKDVHLLYVDAEDKPRSRYIEQIVWEREKERKELDIVKVDKASFKIRLSPHKKMPEIRKTDTALRVLLERTYSPSEIDEYVRCPVTFYYRRILRFEEKQAVKDDIDVMERGIIIHRILFKTFEPYRDVQINASMQGAILRTMTDALEQEFRHRITTGEYYLFKELALFKLESFLRRHIEEAGKKPFVIKYLEHPLTQRLPLNNASISFKGRIDRIDFLPGDDEYVIVDYKTGGTKAYSNRAVAGTDFGSADDIHRRISSFQLPLYIFLFRGSLGLPCRRMNGRLLLLRNNQEELLFKTGKEDEREAIQERYMAGVRTIMEDILNPSRPFSPFDDEGCLACPFNLLCHV
jgi:ATP-dependent helicase/nuclease subunit B